MAQVTHFFAGANSGDGFQNLFSEIDLLPDICKGRVLALIPEL